MNRSIQTFLGQAMAKRNENTLREKNASLRAYRNWKRWANTKLKKKSVQAVWALFSSPVTPD
ncbi:hypothetical protein [Gimesia maris]|uniref:hypothetical protein n=1 Tax=Gimesia maris TaxID=122 RepID=UPI0002E465BA|nr:hypothetical protein [Gimesia maris]